MKRENGSRILFLTFVFLYLPFVWNYAFVHPRTTVDLSAFYWAADATYHAHLSPYNPQVVAKTLAPPRVKRFPQTPFLYPPASLPLFFPLTLASYHTIQIAMLVLNHACVLFLLYFVFFHLLPEREDSIRVFAIVYILNFQPILATIEAGQINLVVCVLICLVWLGTKKKWNDVSLSIPLAASALLKSYPLAIASLLLFHKRYRAFVWFCVIVIAVCALSFLILPDSTWSDWIHYVLPAGVYGRTPAGLRSVASPWNQSINAFTSRLFLDNNFSQPLLSNFLASRLVPIVFSFLIAVVTFFQIKRSCDVEYQFSAFLLALFLIVPLAWEATMVLLLPAIVVAFSRFEQERLVIKVLIVLSSFLIAWPLPVYLPMLRSGLSILLISMKFYGILLLWLFFMMKMRRLRRGAIYHARFQGVRRAGNGALQEWTT